MRTQPTETSASPAAPRDAAEATRIPVPAALEEAEATRTLAAPAEIEPAANPELAETAFLRQASKRAVAEARRDLLAQGIGVVTGAKGNVVRHNADGSLETLYVGTGAEPPQWRRLPE